MKLNKIMLGVSGVMALALTACHDDPTYTPAPATTTPPAYFSISDETEIDLEDTDTQFVVPVYRADGTGEATCNVTTTVTAETGIDTKVFTIPSTVTFADGITRADLVVKFDMANIVPMKDYTFDFKVEGESNPYLTTNVDYVVSYVPWETVKSDAGSEETKIVMNGLVSSGGAQIDWDVTCVAQKHPAQVGFYRLRHPYYTAPEFQDENGNVTTEQRYPESDPLYLFINANNPKSVYIADSKGKAQVFYYTGWVLDKTVANYGEELMLMCTFSAYLNKTFTFPGLDGYFSGEDYGTDAGAYENGVVNFRNHMHWTYPAAADASKGSFGYGSFNKFRIDFPNAEAPKEWDLVGVGLYTDGFISNWFGEANDAYQVTVEQNIDNPNLIRIVNPYLTGVCPFPGEEVKGDYPLVFDVTDPDLVLIDVQALGWQDEGFMYYGCNAGAMYKNGLLGQNTMPITTIKRRGLNDKYENGVITIGHPVLVTPIEGDDENVNVSQLWNNAGFNAGKLTMPDGVTTKNMTAPKAAKPALHSGRVRLTPMALGSSFKVKNTLNSGKMQMVNKKAALSNKITRM